MGSNDQTPDLLRDRLRALGQRPLDPALQAAWLVRLADRGVDCGVSRGRRLMPSLAVVAAVVLAIAVPAVVAHLASGPASQSVPPASTSTARVADLGDGELACTGPPPFAGVEPEGDTEAEREANREREARQFSAWREANCPDDTNGSGGDEVDLPAGTPSGPPAGTQTGPPPES